MRGWTPAPQRISSLRSALYSSSAAWAATHKHKLTDTMLVNARGKACPCAAEKDFFEALGLPEIPPELREGRGEIKSAAAGMLPNLVTLDAIKGVLHCHTTYSDGGATIEEMAKAARHSQCAVGSGCCEVCARQTGETTIMDHTLMVIRYPLPVTCCPT